MYPAKAGIHFFIRIGFYILHWYKWSRLPILSGAGHLTNWKKNNKYVDYKWLVALSLYIFPFVGWMPLITLPSKAMWWVFLIIIVLKRYIHRTNFTRFPSPKFQFPWGRSVQYWPLRARKLGLPTSHGSQVPVHSRSMHAMSTIECTEVGIHHKFEVPSVTGMPTWQHFLEVRIETCVESRVKQKVRFNSQHKSRHFFPWPNQNITWTDVNHPLIVSWGYKSRALAPYWDLLTSLGLGAPCELPFKLLSYELDNQEENGGWRVIQHTCVGYQS